MPWLGDRTTGCLGESYLMDNHALYAKWMGDIEDSQRQDGNISDVSPAYWRLYTNNVTWPAAFPFGCDMLYRQYGDLRPFAEHYASIKKYLSYMKTHFCKEGLITQDKYGDWCMPPERLDMIFSKDPTRITNGELISSCYYVYLCRMMARYAGQLNFTADARTFGAEADTMAEAINGKYLRKDGYDNNTITANLLPLAMGIVPEERREAVQKKMVGVIEANGAHVACGVIGIQWLMRYLADIGRNDLAYKMATQTTYPGWGYMIANGATTIWELWNGNTADPAMNSGNHVMLLGDLLPWCYERLGGIRPLEPGFRRMEIKPDFSLTALNKVEVAHPSPYGVIKSGWRRDGDGLLEWEVVIPANTSAVLTLPDGTKKEVLSGTHHFSLSEDNKRPPIMGWSSWNTFHVNISDSLIRSQADAMVRLGLKDVGYTHINIDDGFFGWRDSTGVMHPHPQRFPNGMKVVADYIHSLGLKAGIYSDAGANTCGSRYDNDENGFGVGLYGHEVQDARLYFREWGYDFIKIDYCGAGTWLDLEEQKRYTTICETIRQEAGHPVSINICRWAFPGTWAKRLATSWRISPDIRPRWSSIKSIIAKNLYLSAFAGDGHYNDMDMLEVGRGLTPDEEEVHVGMWCMMSSPMLIGCDLNTLNDASLALLKNRELLAINQDALGLQAYVASRQGEGYVMVKDLERHHDTVRAVAFYNPSDSAVFFSVPLSELELGGKATVRDVVRHEKVAVKNGQLQATVPAHGIRVMRVEAQSRLEAVRYEAEWAYLSAYDDLGKRKTPVKYVPTEGASGGICVANVGGETESYAEWRNVWSDMGGTYLLHVRYVDEPRLKMLLQVNGQEAGCLTIGTAAKQQSPVFKEASFEVKLEEGYNIVRLHSPLTLLPPLDCIRLEKL